MLRFFYRARSVAYVMEHLSKSMKP
jgi:hypothetical protein